MRFDRFDICAAYNLYSQLWGWDDYTRGIQSRLAGIKYRPGRSDEFLESISDNAHDIYLGLVLKHQGREAMLREHRGEMAHGS